jgi:hypothetical protein
MGRTRALKRGRSMRRILRLVILMTCSVEIMNTGCQKILMGFAKILIFCASLMYGRKETEKEKD